MTLAQLQFLDVSAASEAGDVVPLHPSHSEVLQPVAESARSCAHRTQQHDHCLVALESQAAEEGLWK